MPGKGAQSVGRLKRQTRRREEDCNNVSWRKTEGREVIARLGESHLSTAEYVSTFPFTSSNSTNPGHRKDSDSNRGNPDSGRPLRMYLQEESSRGKLAVHMGRYGTSLQT
jgi:hypothetical protein